MNPPTPQSQTSFQKPAKHWIGLTCPFGLVPFYVLAACLPLYANSSTSIRSISADNQLKFYNGSKWVPLQKRTINQHKLNRTGHLVSLPRSEQASLSTQRNTSSFNSSIVGSAEFFFNCKVNLRDQRSRFQVGDVTLTWKGEERRKSPCQVFKVVSNGGLRLSQQDPEAAIASATKTLHPTQIANNDLSDRIFYCNSVSELGNRWGFSASHASWNLLSPSDPCNQAFAECEQVSGNDCMLAIADERSIREDNLTISLQCNGISAGDPRFTRPNIRGLELVEQLNTLKNNARAIGASSCSVNVTTPNELNVSPFSNTLDSVNVYETENTLVVVGLVGKVLVSSTQLPQGVVVSAGEVYLYNKQPSSSNPATTRLTTCPSQVDRFLVPSQVPSATQSYPSSDFYKGKQLNDLPDISTKQIIAQTSRQPRGSSGSQIPWGTLIPGLIDLFTPSNADSSSQPGKQPSQPSPTSDVVVPTRQEPTPSQRRTAVQQPSFSVPVGGVLCGISAEMRQGILTTAPSVKTFLAETNWSDATLSPTYQAAIQQQFLNGFAQILY
ncbi:MAG: hypothetical protein IGS48_09175 [Oscillatoriales cyanobacterium C42_A2020_001]|nr:hypothetical protein [Leptolyngbyaceae cyanobacterium C42_A2020_001]